MSAEQNTSVQDDLIVINWLPREQPLEACAVCGIGSVATALAKNLLQRHKDNLTGFRAVAGDGDDLLVIVAGIPQQEAAESVPVLPWADGAIYLGYEPSSTVLTPTNIEANVPAALLERAFQLRYPTLFPPYAILPKQNLVIPLTSALRLDEKLLLHWLEDR